MSKRTRSQAHLPVDTRGRSSDSGVPATATNGAGTSDTRSGVGADASTAPPATSAFGAPVTRRQQRLTSHPLRLHGGGGAPGAEDQAASSSNASAALAPNSLMNSNPISTTTHSPFTAANPPAHEAHGHSHTQPAAPASGSIINAIAANEIQRNVRPRRANERYAASTLGTASGKRSPDDAKKKHTASTIASNHASASPVNSTAQDFGNDTKSSHLPPVKNPFDVLASDEVHSVMQMLDRPSLLRLARCNRRMLLDADSPAAWNGLPIETLGRTHLKDDQRLQRTGASLLRNQLLSIRWTFCSAQPEEAECEAFEKLAVFLRVCMLTIDKGFYVKRPDLWTRMLTHAALRNVEYFELGQSKFRMPAEVVTHLYSVARNLNTLALIKIDDATRLDCLAQFAYLTDLKLLSRSSALTLEQRTCVKACRHLCALEVSLAGCSAAEFVDFYSGDQMRTVERLRIRDVDASLVTPAEYARLFAGMPALLYLDLEESRHACIALLPHVHHAPALRHVRVQPCEDEKPIDGWNQLADDIKLLLSRTEDRHATGSTNDDKAPTPPPPGHRTITRFRVDARPGLHIVMCGTWDLSVDRPLRRCVREVAHERFTHADVVDSISAQAQATAPLNPHAHLALADTSTSTEQSRPARRARVDPQSDQHVELA